MIADSHPRSCMPCLASSIYLIKMLSLFFAFCPFAPFLICLVAVGLPQLVVWAISLSALDLSTQSLSVNPLQCDNGGRGA